MNCHDPPAGSSPPGAQGALPACWRVVDGFLARQLGSAAGLGAPGLNAAAARVHRGLRSGCSVPIPEDALQGWVAASYGLWFDRLFTHSKAVRAERLQLSLPAVP